MSACAHAHDLLSPKRRGHACCAPLAQVCRRPGAGSSDGHCRGLGPRAPAQVRACAHMRLHSARPMYDSSRHLGCACERLQLKAPGAPLQCLCACGRCLTGAHTQALCHRGAACGFQSWTPHGLAGALAWLSRAAWQQGQGGAAGMCDECRTQSQTTHDCRGALPFLCAQ